MLFIILYQREAHAGEVRGEVITYKEAWARPDGWPEYLRDLVSREGQP